jgi:signal peptide peptidase SppA
MRYERILRAVAAEPWAMRPEAIGAMVDVLRYRLEHGRRDPADIAARIEPRREREIARAPGAVAVIPIHGIISQRARMLDDISAPGSAATDDIGRAFATAVASDEVKAIVLDIDSPGGRVPGVLELHDQVMAARGAKPIIAVANSMAASAAYWIATAAEEVVVTPSGEVGSIGVYSVHEDVSRMLEAAGVTETIVAVPEAKAELADSRPLGEVARAEMERRVGLIYERFVTAVAEGRGVTAARVREGFRPGRMAFAAEAVELGMADRVATLDQTLARFGVSQLSPAPAAAARRTPLARMRRELEMLRF